MADPRWLDDDEQQIWRSYLWATQMLQEALDRELRRDSGLPHAYYQILAMLSEAPEQRMTMTRLARIVRSSASRLSHAVARLEENGWVRRVPHPTDRRTTIAELTDQGRTVLVEAAPGHVDAVRTYLFDPLTPQQVEQLGEIVEAVRKRLVVDSVEDESC
jgi:DNA-binding MarR family transcriptional regulator